MVGSEAVLESEPVLVEVVSSVGEVVESAGTVVVWEVESTVVDDEVVSPLVPQAEIPTVMDRTSADAANGDRRMCDMRRDASGHRWGLS